MDQRVGLVVLQADVVPGLVAFDEVGLQQERLRLGVGDRHVDPVGAVDHPPDAVAPRVGVGPDPIPQVDGLADVADGVALVEEIHPRIPREVGRPLPDRGGIHHRNPNGPTVMRLTCPDGGAGGESAGVGKGEDGPEPRL